MDDLGGENPPFSERSVLVTTAWLKVRSARPPRCREGVTNGVGVGFFGGSGNRSNTPTKGANIITIVNNGVIYMIYNIYTYIYVYILLTDVFTYIDIIDMY